MDSPLLIHVEKSDGHYRLLIQNRSDETLQGVEVLTVNPEKYAEGEVMQIKFDAVEEIAPRSTEPVRHHVQIVKDQEWVASDFYSDDLLMCLTERYSKGVSYDIHVSWLVNGAPGHNQTLKAGAGSGI